MPPPATASGKTQASPEVLAGHMAEGLGRELTVPSGATCHGAGLAPP
ncbi:MAG: hypothetical protein LBR22_05630 [Desulfovibrio sp.]|nr:hypothetical protein [Desulfovibrio sp.]